MPKKDHGLEALEFIRRICQTCRYDAPSLQFPAIIEEIDAILSVAKAEEENANG